MILSPPERIADYTARGWWGTRRIHDWMDDAVRTRPDAEALVDAPNRADFIDGAPRRLTWRELEVEAVRYAGLLLEPPWSAWRIAREGAAFFAATSGRPK